MGGLMSKLWTMMFGTAERKIILVGLNNAGKTTTLYQLHLGEVVATTPTIGSNVEQFTYQNIKFCVWDLGGQETLRATWQSYYMKTDAVIMVVDCTDRTTIGTVKSELFRMLAHEDLSHAIVLIYANKQDVKTAMPAAELSKLLELHEIKDHEWHIQACSALTGVGLHEGMEWLASRVKQKPPA